MMKKNNYLNIIVFFIILTACLASCIEMNDSSSPPDGLGTLILNFGTDENSRTIMPKNPELAAIKILTLEFTPKEARPIQKIDRSFDTGSQLSVYLEEGTYDLHITAFLDIDKTTPIAAGDLFDIQIDAGTTENRPVYLNAYTEAGLLEGSGTFTWNITLPESRVAAVMNISLLGSSSSLYNINLLDNGTGSLELDSGMYEVEIVIGKEESLEEKTKEDIIGEKTFNQQIKWKETLHIHKNLTSPYTKVFDDSDYYKNYYSVKYWDRNGTLLFERFYEHGSKAVVQYATKDNYMFSEWQNEDGTKYDFDTLINSDTDLYVRWKGNLAYAEVTITSTHVYNGTIQEPSFTVEHDGILLEEGVHYYTQFTQSTPDKYVNAGEHYFMIFSMLGEYDYYKTVYFTIEKATPVVTMWPTTTAILGQNLSQVPITGGSSTIPGTFTWTNPSSPVGSVGTQTHSITFTPNDTVNYSTLAQNVNVIVKLIEMVSVPAGSFLMGSPSTEIGRIINNENQSRTVTLSAFSMGKYQVTQELWQAVMTGNTNGISATPSSFKSAVAGESGTPGKLPVECANWYDILVFCNRLSAAQGLTPAYSIIGSTDPADWGDAPTSSNATWNAVTVVSGSTGYRLPTEAQWEYACRAGTTTAFNDGVTQDWNDSTAVEKLGWYSSNSSSKTHEVGQKLPNNWGLYDMHGNLVEWCWDWYADSYPGSAETDPTGAASGSYRVLRNGGWSHIAQGARSASRGSSFYPQYRNVSFGFRLACP